MHALLPGHAGRVGAVVAFIRFVRGSSDEVLLEPSAHPVICLQPLATNGSIFDRS